MSNNVSSATRSRDLHVRALSEGDRAAECVMSTDAVDSYGEVVDQGSWRLQRYQSNPVVLFAHDSRQPIGRAERVRVEGGELKCRIVFATTPKADEVYQLVKERVLRGVSVGFKPGRVAMEKREGKEVPVLYACELLELSVVSIPANSEALMRSKAATTATASPPTDAAAELARLAAFGSDDADDIALRLMAQDAGIDLATVPAYTSAATELSALASRERERDADTRMIANSVGVDFDTAVATAPDRQLAALAAE